jgi:hypothetical protein
MEPKKIAVRINNNAEWEQVIAVARLPSGYYEKPVGPGAIALTLSGGGWARIEWFEARPEHYILITFDQWLGFRKSGATSVSFDEPSTSARIIIINVPKI